MVTNGKKGEVAETLGEDKVDKHIIRPLTLCLVYTWILSLIAKESGPLPVVFSEVSFTTPIVVSIAYLGLIWLGNKWMAKREPFGLKNYMVTYNFFQAILNMYMGCSLLYEKYKKGGSIWGNTMDWNQSGFNISFLIWMHYSNKYIELCDTAFMVLRKKTNQISFLHVYHHVLLIWAWFAVCRLMPGADSYFGAMINSFVHVIMYTYYLVTLLGYKCFFKNYITIIQMVQFVACLGQAIAGVFNQCMGPFLPWVQIWVMTNMLVLFSNFYRKAYTKPITAATAPSDTNGTTSSSKKKAQ
jgi:elongation of very long chain fatty acids protein 4